MPKKKKEEIKLTPSKYQTDIINFIKHDVGNLVVEAAAGCGKTSTLVMAINEIDNERKILFCAFNKDIVKDIKKKTKEHDNVEVMTVHGLGLRMLRNNLEREYKLIPNENKYRSHIINNMSFYSSINTYSLGKKLYIKYLNNICQLINLLRLNLSQTEEDALELIYLHDIDIIADEVDVAFKVIQWGKNDLDEVDYTDMIWLPNELHLKPYGVQYDFVFGDECQDFSTAQRELLLKCKKINTRFIFVGDENQSIYGFASADKESFRKLKELPNTKTLPLRISYRCAKNIVRFAQNYVPTIEANDADDRMGEIRYDVALNEVSDGDMILCRNNAPLMKIYNDFIKSGKKCFIRGKDIGKNLKTLLDTTDKELLNVDLRHDGVFVRLYDALFTMRDNIIRNQAIDKTAAMNTPIITNFLDKIRALETLSDGILTTKELREKIDNVFSDKNLEGISLSTIHKAKGLEANNVYIACKSLMPSKSANKDWEREQERNLIYVAYTRAKNTLGFLSESDFGTYISNSSESLKVIENKVNLVLDKVSMGIEPTNSEQIKLFYDKKPTIEVIKRGTSKNLSETQTKISNINNKSLNSLFQRKLSKIKR